MELASQRLSRAKHYDFGMRTLKKVLQKCEELKQQSINDPRQNSSESKEMLLCQKAIMRVVTPGLVQQVMGPSSLSFACLRIFSRSIDPK